VTQTAQNTTKLVQSQRVAVGWNNRQGGSRITIVVVLSPITRAVWTCLC